MKPRLRDRLRRRVGPPELAADRAEAEPPCIPCGQKEGTRPFSFNAPADTGVTGADVPRPVPGMTETVMDDRVLVVQPDSTTHVLNASAALIWLGLDGRTTVADLVDELQRETGAARDVLDADVRVAVARFVASGIVTLDHART